MDQLGAGGRTAITISGLALGAAVVAAAILFDPRSARLAANTLGLSLAVTALSVPAGTLLALLIVRTDLPGRRALVFLLAMMLFVPLYLVAAAWQAALGPQGWFTLSWSQEALLSGWRGAVWVHAVAAVPWVALIAGAGVWFAEPQLEEQALLDGTALQVLFRVTLRRAAGAIGVAALWVAITTAGEMTAADLFLVRTYAEEVYTELAIGAEPGIAPLSVLPGAVFTVTLVLAALVVCRYLVRPARASRVPPRPIIRMRRAKWPIAALVMLCAVVGVGIPVGSLFFKAGVTVVTEGSRRIRGWSPEKCLSIIAESPGRFAEELAWSGVLAVLAATICVALAVPLAAGATGRGGRRTWLAWGAAAACLAIPAPIVGLALIWLMNRSSVPLLVYLYDRTIAAPCAALVIRSLPVATLVVWHALATVPSETLEVAATEGANAWTRLWRIALPQRLHALTLAWLLAFAISLGELAASILVVPPGVTTLSIQIFGLLHYGIEDQVAAICLVELAVIAAMVAAGWYVARRWVHGA